MIITKSDEIETRDDFAILGNWRKLWRALEIGVDRADWSVKFLREWRGHTWVGVDPYQEFPQMRWDREADFQIACHRLAEFDGVARLVRCSSLSFAIDTAEICDDAMMPRFEPDFVYIDGAHDYDSVKLDIDTWWPRLSKFGIIAGHDFSPEHPGVVRAVTEFAESNGLLVRLTYDFPSSWYAYKNEPGPEWRRCAT